MREYLFMALVAAAVTYLLVPLVRRFAIRIGAAPEIRERDVHTTPTPRLGGLAMYGGLVAGLLVASELAHTGKALSADGDPVMALLIAGGIITVTGFLDDWWGMDPFIKLAGQVAAAGVLVYYDLRLVYLPLPQDWGGSTSLDYTLSTIITILVVVVTINAVNFVDGLDGLAAGIVCIAAMSTWAYSILLSQSISGNNITTTAGIAAVLIGTCLGFLPHNFHPAKIFMGDTGAMLIGLVLASSIVTVTPLDPAVIEDMNKFAVLLPLLLPAAVLVLPLVDLITAVVRRTSYGMSPFAPDRGHLHHRLMDIGHSHRRSVLIMYAWAFLFAFGIVAMSWRGVPVLLFPVVILLAIGVLVLMAAPRWRGRGGAPRRGKEPTDDDGPPTGPMPPILPASDATRPVRRADDPPQERASAEGKPVIPAFPGGS
ncbi:glycosyltransferase family 4 protein [Nonomuraea cavernae]|uniref:Undecaprenyl-phosphate alpha-N-acetylglucosaminyl 1-phosphate transferase n=1 Tax=Nonomuraea cavernae TaxID=2045107 RepID=A0A918DNC3_9ACTN|nr:MraY family glycosyltransferase [Nonomuraea cavernae]MCA2188302.1 undecaprenyl/decaprenyl-phosphate alpha-N-acetylglucosaminyl 1-phosphate transferase [Nonomuraea cavernae]GGO73709.1 undecaprenyl-phosphate alpha-N-acetylglucosaminyl 1-phosphate transferase [Nonomuraea cavernae]